MSFTKNDLDIIKSKISLRNELEKKTKIIQKGKDYWCCCPFHEEKTPSCKINEDSYSFYCFGCGVRGDIFTIYTDLYNYNFVDAVKELSTKVGLRINFESITKSKQDSKIDDILEISCLWFQDNLNYSSADECNSYLKKRKLTKITIEKYKLGYSSNIKTSLYNFLKSKSYTDEELLKSNIVKKDNNNKIRDYFYKRLIFPIMNIQGRVIGFGGRSLDNSNPKYINSPESKIFQKRNILYNLNYAKNSARKKNNLLICEGYMDVISLNQNGISAVVAPLGTALTEDQLELSWRYTSKTTIMFDGDNAGLRASYKSAIMALSLVTPKKFLQFVTLPKDYDPDTYINEVSFDKFLEKLKNPKTLSQFIFNESSKSISLENVDEKISYDEYLDNLIGSIKDRKIQYFYKSEFKSLFFNKIRKISNVVKVKKFPIKKETNLSKKQIFSFFATAINHLGVRKEILDQIISTKLINDNESKLANELLKSANINLQSDELIKKLRKMPYKNIVDESLTSNIYQLFVYSSPLYDPQKAYEEVLKSLNNLNTRLSNLQKINKSLDNFINKSDQLNWDDLQKINLELSNEE